MEKSRKSKLAGAAFAAMFVVTVASVTTCIGLYRQMRRNAAAFASRVQQGPLQENAAASWRPYEIPYGLLWDISNGGAFGKRDGEPKKAEPSTLPPDMRFADDGRYLPPGDNRVLAVKTVNVTNVVFGVGAVPLSNIVPILALDNNAYDNVYRRWWYSDDDVKDGFVKDFAAVAETNAFKVACETDKPVVTGFPVGRLAGKKGVFLLSVAAPENGGMVRSKLVCATDIGLGARVTPSGVAVWAVSLTTGEPVKGAKVTVYSAGNVVAASGETGENGYAFCRNKSHEKPFAVVAVSSSGDDTSFLELSSSVRVEEGSDSLKPYLAKGECDAWLWTERGIYRHGEKIMAYAVFRDRSGAAPEPFPCELKLFHASTGRVAAKKTLVTDARGTVFDDTISVPAELPDGSWLLAVSTPGGSVLARRTVSVEEFVPPQVRVKVTPDAECAIESFKFTIASEYLFGGVAKNLVCEGKVSFSDIDFAPAGWDGYSFGDDSRALAPAIEELSGYSLDEEGKAVIPAPFGKKQGKPAAAVLANVQGTVFEDGGRPVSARARAVLHAYPWYVGATLGGHFDISSTAKREIKVACVLPDGKRVGEAKRLKAVLEKIETVYSYRRNPNGWASWTCDVVPRQVGGTIDIEVPAGGDATLPLDIRESGDWALRIFDPGSDVSFRRKFFASADAGSDAVSAKLSGKAVVAMTPEKPFYRPGETPRITVRSPFPGTALLTVSHGDIAYAKVFDLTNATSEITIPEAQRSWAPSVLVSLAVVQSVSASSSRLAVCAHGSAVVEIRPEEREIPVKLSADVGIVPVSCAETGSVVSVSIEALSPVSTGETAVVTVVDEGIMSITGERFPDPARHFAKPRRGEVDFYDIYSRILPALDGDAKGSPVKTGGDTDASMFSRLNPVDSRRFRPLAKWEKEVPLSNGRGKTSIVLPEFAGEVRVSAVVVSAKAAGAASLVRKVTPKIVMRPDAPRFASPGDVFEATLSLSNRSGVDGEIGYKVEYSTAGGGFAVAGSGAVAIKNGDTKVLRFPVAASEPGEMTIRYSAFDMSGKIGEKRNTEISLPVRPSAAWRTTGGVERLLPGESRELAAGSGGDAVWSAFTRREVGVFASPLAELKEALEWLAEYPHGCLEQTVSRVFPLVTAGGVLNRLGSSVATNRKEFVAAGVGRVVSMIRRNGFSMWPDCDYPPWDDEVSLYAAHFLLEAERGGADMNPAVVSAMLGLMGAYATSTNLSAAAYACHNLALAGFPAKDMQLKLFSARESLDLLSRARLARAFALSGDMERANALLESSLHPGSVKEAAFALLALEDSKPGDARAAELARYLASRRDKSRFAWGTTSENAHALLALAAHCGKEIPANDEKASVTVDGSRSLGEGEFFRRAGGGAAKVANTGKTPVYVSWRAMELPKAAPAGAESSGGLSVSRRYLRTSGEEYDIANARKGDLVIVEIALSSDETREEADLVVEDLLPAAFECTLALDGVVFSPSQDEYGEDHWVMRSDRRDDRVLVFSKRFTLEKGKKACFRYAARIVSTGDYALPGVSVEDMYDPRRRARSRGGHVVVRDRP